MKTKNRPLLAAISKRAKNAARAVKQGVFVLGGMESRGLGSEDRYAAFECFGI